MMKNLEFGVNYAEWAIVTRNCTSSDAELALDMINLIRPLFEDFLEEPYIESRRWVKELTTTNLDTGKTYSVLCRLTIDPFDQCMVVEKILNFLNGLSKFIS